MIPDILLERETLKSLRFILPALGIILAVTYALMGKRALPALRGLVAAVLVFAVTAALFFYTAPHWKSGGYMNGYEFFHYYLGAKYAPEIGYTGLYLASWEAQRDNGDRHLPGTVRNLETEGMISPRSNPAAVKAVRDAFTPERWETFRADVDYIKFKDMKLWDRMHRDKGYNATPPWTLVAMPLTNLTNAEPDESIRWLSWLDVVFVLVAMACVAWAFGPRAMLLLILFICGHYLTSHFTLKAALLRLDWVMCLLMAVSLLKKEHFYLAGALTGYAALMRVFPAFFAIGVAGAWGWELLRRGPHRRDYLNFFLGMAVISVVMVAASAAVLGIDYWQAFLEKIRAHSDDLTPWRVGYKYVFLLAPEGLSPGGISPAVYLENHKALYYGGMALALLLTVLAVRNLPPHRALILGFVPVFFLIAPTYYYMVMLVVPFLFFAEEGERWPRALGMVLMFATAYVGHALYLEHSRSWMTFFWVSALIFAACVYMVLTGLLTARPKGDPGEPGAVAQQSG